MMKNAKDKVELFKHRYGMGHLYYAYHAAFPLALTPELMYLIWYNFRMDINKRPLKNQQDERIVIPWVAMSDLLFSSLCKQVGFEQYELYPEIRNILLDQLVENKHLGEKRVIELAVFFKNYYEHMKTSLSDEANGHPNIHQLFVDSFFPGNSVQKDLQLYHQKRNNYLKSIIDQTFQFVSDIKKKSEDTTVEKIAEETIDVDFNVPLDKFINTIKTQTDENTANRIIDNELKQSSNKGKTVDNEKLIKIIDDLIKKYKISTLNSQISMAEATIKNQLNPPLENFHPNPTIFIGIGDIGSKIVYGIYQKWENEFKQQISENISFIVCDTNRKIEDEFQVTDNLKVLMLPNYFSLKKTEITSKYQDYSPDDEITNQLLDLEFGANNNRLHGHMSFLKALIDHDYNFEPIENAIKMTLSPDQNTSSAPLHIIIVNALGGGTGSGTFIPFALYSRHYFKTLPSRKRVKIGFISTVSNTDKSDERQNENDAIEEIKSILMNKKQLLAKKYGSIFNGFERLFDYGCVYYLNKKNRLKPENNLISDSMVFQYLSPMTDYVFEKKYKAFNRLLPFCNPLVYEYLYPKEDYEQFIKLKARNQFSFQFSLEVDSDNIHRRVLDEKDPDKKAFYNEIINSTYDREEKKSTCYIRKLQDKLKNDVDVIEEKFNTKQLEKGWNVLFNKSILSITSKKKNNILIKEMKRVHNDLLSYQSFIEDESRSYVNTVKKYLTTKDGEFSEQYMLKGLHPIAMSIIISELKVEVNRIWEDTHKQNRSLSRKISQYVNFEKQIFEEKRIDNQLENHFNEEKHLESLKRKLTIKCMLVLFEELIRMTSNYDKGLNDCFFSIVKKELKRFEKKKQEHKNAMNTNPLESVKKAPRPDLEFNVKIPIHKVNVNNIMEDILDYLTQHYQGLSLDPDMEQHITNEINMFIDQNVSILYQKYHKSIIQINVIDAIRQNAEIDNIPIKKYLEDEINELVRKTKKRGYPSEIYFLMHPECYQELIKLEINPFDKTYHLHQTDLISQHRIICFCDNYALDMSTDDDFIEKFRQLGTVKRFYSTEKK